MVSYSGTLSWSDRSRRPADRFPLVYLDEVQSRAPRAFGPLRVHRHQAPPGLEIGQVLEFHSLAVPWWRSLISCRRGLRGRGRLGCLPVPDHHPGPARWQDHFPDHAHLSKSRQVDEVDSRQYLFLSTVNLLFPPGYRIVDIPGFFLVVYLSTVYDSLQD